MSNIKVQAARGRVLWRSRFGTLPPISTNIPNVPAPLPSATFNARSLPSYNTTSVIQSVFWTWYKESNTKIWLHRLSDTDAPNATTTGLRVEFQSSGTKFTITPYLGGTAQFTNIQFVNTSSLPPEGTLMQTTHTATGAIVNVRLDTGENITPQSTATAVTNLGWNATYKGTVVSAWADGAGTNLQTYGVGDSIPLTINSVEWDSSFHPTIQASYTGSNRTGWNLELRYNNSTAIGAKVPAIVVLGETGHVTLTGPTDFAAGEAQFGSKVVVRVYEIINGVESGVFRDTAPYTMPTVAAVPMAMSLNLNGARYYEPWPISSDLGRSSSIRDDLKCILVPFSGVDGIYDVQLTPGTTITGLHNGADSQAISITPVNAGAGTYTITIAGDNRPYESGGGGDARGVTYSGPAPTSFVMQQRGVAAGAINPRWITEQFGKGMRDLDICGGNYTPQSEWQTLANWPDNRELPIRAFAAKHAVDPTYVNYHLVQCLVLDDDVVYREANIVKNHFPNNALAKLIHELSNEDWSDSFPARARTLVEAAREGFLNGGTPTAPGTKYVVKWVKSFGIAPAMATGETIFSNNSHSLTGSYSLYRANKPIADGTTITAADFDLVANLPQLLAGGALWLGWRHNRVLQIYEEVLGTERYNRQILPGIYCQTGILPSTKNAQLDAVPGYRQKIKILGTSAYLHHSSATKNATSGLTMQGLAQEFIDRIPVAKAEIQAHINSMRDMGPFQLGIYEGGPHPMNFMPGVTQHYIDTYKAVVMTSLMRAVDYDWAKMAVEIGTGYWFYYSGFGFIWGLKRDWNANVTKHRYDGHILGLTGGTRPALA
ncbi:MAG TPA: hypothetical protein VF638_14315 [Sphingomonas sp.]|jgi:hypothetical protein